jgi:hypothetical protein
LEDREKGEFLEDGRWCNWLTILSNVSSCY